MEITPEELLDILKDASFYDPKDPKYSYMSHEDWIAAAQYLQGSFIRAGFKIIKY